MSTPPSTHLETGRVDSCAPPNVNDRRPLRPRIKIAMNAIVEAIPRFGSRVYLWEIASALACESSVALTLLVGEKQASAVPFALRPHAREIPVSGGKSYLQVFRQRRIQKALNSFEIELYFVPNTIPLIYKTIPTIVTIHDLVELRVKKYSFIRTSYRFLVNLIAAHVADHVITVSEASKKDIVRILKVPESKVTVVYNGVAPEFQPLDPSFCTQYLESKYSLRGGFLLASGGLGKNKNIGRLLLALKILKDRNNGQSIVIFGNPNDVEFKEMTESIRSLGLEDSVVLPGFVPREDLPIFYNAASIVVYPSLYEGFGLPILESMACGTPVIASLSSSIPEVAGEATLLVDPYSPEQIADAIERLQADDGLRADLIFRGLARSRQFTWQKAADETLAVISRVISSRQ